MRLYLDPPQQQREIADHNASIIIPSDTLYRSHSDGYYPEMGSHTEKTWDVRPAPPLAGSGEGTREESRRLGADSIWVPVTAAFSLFTLIIYLGHRVHTLDYASDPKPRTSQVVLLIELIVAG